MYQQLDDDRLIRLTRIFKALGEPTRLRILNLLCGGEYAVGDIAQQLGLSQSAISHQLRILKDLRLVKARRAGVSIYYTGDDEHVLGLLKQAIDHVAHF